MHPDSATSPTSSKGPASSTATTASSSSLTADSAPISAARAAVPVPRVLIAIRPARADDFPFIDALQKQHRNQVGFMPRMQLMQYIEEGSVLVAEGGESHQPSAVSDQQEPSPPPSPSGRGREECSPPAPLPEGEGRVGPRADSRKPKAIGYCIARDRYYKRDDVGIIFQLNVAPGSHRRLIGASLIRAVFDRAAYGCKLFCCWCAQDIEANRFWESLGFVPLAFRAGGRRRGRAVGSRLSAVGGKVAGGTGADTGGTPAPPTPVPLGRVHIFWQRRVREGDNETPFWFPCWTNAGAIRADRIVLPLPPGVHWSEVRPAVLPVEVSEAGAGAKSAGDEVASIEASRPVQSGRRLPAAVARVNEKNDTTMPARVSPSARPRPARSIGRGGPWHTRPAGAEETGGQRGAVVQATPERGRSATPPAASERRHVAFARELRDRYLEHINQLGGVPGQESFGKYDVARVLPVRDAEQARRIAPGREPLRLAA